MLVLLPNTWNSRYYYAYSTEHNLALRLSFTTKKTWFRKEIQKTVTDKALALKQGYRIVYKTRKGYTDILSQIKEAIKHDPSGLDTEFYLTFYVNPNNITKKNTIHVPAKTLRDILLENNQEAYYQPPPTWTISGLYKKRLLYFILYRSRASRIYYVSKNKIALITPSTIRRFKNIKPRYIIPFVYMVFIIR